MKYLEILTLPTLRFAHIHKADHYHHITNTNFSRLEITYLKEGSLIHETSEGIFTSKKGDITCSCQTHATSQTEHFHCHHTVCANVSWQYTDNPDHLLIPSLIPACAATRDIEKQIDQFIYHSYLYKKAPEKAACDFLQILCKINQCARALETQQTHSGSILAERAKKYIHRNIYDPITQEEVAAHLGITPGYLCSIFKQSEQITVMKYINNLKLQQIKELMEAKNLKLYEAAAMFGYSDPNYVSALYKKTFGHNITTKSDHSMLCPKDTDP